MKLRFLLPSVMSDVIRKRRSVREAAAEVGRNRSELERAYAQFLRDKIARPSGLATVAAAGCVLGMLRRRRAAGVRGPLRTLASVALWTVQAVRGLSRPHEPLPPAAPNGSSELSAEAGI